MIEVLKSKLHCVRVTEANLNYMGSITIDEDLMDAANMIARRKPTTAVRSRPSASRWWTGLRENRCTSTSATCR